CAEAVTEIVMNVKAAADSKRIRKRSMRNTSAHRRSTRRLAASAFEFQHHEAGDRDGEKMGRGRPQIGNAAGPRLDPSGGAYFPRGFESEGKLLDCLSHGSGDR